MGIQSWRRGMHTGNTVRACRGTHYHHTYASQSIIVKSVYNDSPMLVQQHTMYDVDDDDVIVPSTPAAGKEHNTVCMYYELTENVEYSLKKKARWNLPQQLKADIQDILSDSDQEISLAKLDNEKLEGLTLIERHKLHKPQYSRYCESIGVYSTHLASKKVLPRTATYINANSVLNHGKGRSHGRKHKKQKRKRGAEVEPEKSAEVHTASTPQVVFNVLYPVPPTCSLHYKNVAADYMHMGEVHPIITGVRQRSCLTRRRTTAHHANSESLQGVFDEEAAIDNDVYEEICEYSLDDNRENGVEFAYKWSREDGVAFVDENVREQDWMSEDSNICQSREDRVEFVDEDGWQQDWVSDDEDAHVCQCDVVDSDLQDFVVLPMSESQPCARCSGDMSCDAYADFRDSDSDDICNHYEDYSTENVLLQKLEMALQTYKLPGNSRVKKTKKRRKATKQVALSTGNTLLQHVVVVNEEEVNDTEPLQNQIVRPPPNRLMPDFSSPTSLPVSVEVISSEFAPVALREKFGSNFVQPSSLPATVMINVSQRSRDMLERRGTPCNLDQLDLEMWLVIRKMESQSAEQTDRVLAHIYSNLNLQSIALETVNSCLIYGVDALVDSAAKLILHIPSECMRMREMQESVCQYRRSHHRSLRLIESATRVCVEPMSASSVVGLVNTVQTTTTPGLLDLSVTYPCGHDDVCDICMESVAVGGGGVPMATALLPCQHWFCNRCWVAYIGNHVTRGIADITCPHYKCSSVVDGLTLVLLGGVQLHRRWLNLVERSRLSIQLNLTWCPNVWCGRALWAVPETTPVRSMSVAVLCHCGVTMCTRCHGEAHWPATCDLAQNYMERLRQTGDISHVCYENVTFTVHVKFCPSCNYPIDKNGGCPHMQCRCGHSFCWTCRQSLAAHDAERCKDALLKPGLYQSHKKIVLRHIETRLQASVHKSRLYSHAVYHRWQRSEFAVHKLHAAARQAANKLKVLKTRPAFNSTESLATAMKSRLAIQTMFAEGVNTVSQLHLVCEYTAVLLEGHHSAFIHSCLDLLNFLCIQLHQILVGESNVDTVDRLQRLTDAAQMCVCRLANKIGGQREC